MNRIALAALLLLGFLFHVPYAATAGEIGAATKIVRTVTGRLAGRSARLSRGDSVFLNQRVRAGRSSFGQFRLNDDTKLAVNANSSLVLDRAVFSSTGSGGKLVLKAAKGAFRFATGNMPSKAYKVVTPSSTIGVRGTMFDVFVGSRGQTIVTLLHGEVRACNRAGRCRTLRSRCDAVRIEPNGQFVQANRPNRRVLGGETARSAIPFLISQRRLSRSLRLPSYAAARCASSSMHPTEESDPSEGENGGENDNEGGGHGGTSGPSSDIRLKRDIALVESMQNGLKLYRFKYIWSDIEMVGVMAQDVLQTYPDAVSTDDHGYYRVDYRMLGLRMTTFAAWKQLKDRSRQARK